MFARTWAQWIGERGGVSVVDPFSYLNYAEPFVLEFLSDLAAGRTGGGERPPVSAAFCACVLEGRGCWKNGWNLEVIEMMRGLQRASAKIDNFCSLG